MTEFERGRGLSSVELPSMFNGVGRRAPAIFLNLLFALKNLNCWTVVIGADGSSTTRCDLVGEKVEDMGCGEKKA